MRIREHPFGHRIPGPPWGEDHDIPGETGSRPGPAGGTGRARGADPGAHRRDLLSGPHRHHIASQPGRLGAQPAQSEPVAIALGDWHDPLLAGHHSILMSPPGSGVDMQHQAHRDLLVMYQSKAL